MSIDPALIETASSFFSKHIDWIASIFLPIIHDPLFLGIVTACAVVLLFRVPLLRDVAALPYALLGSLLRSVGIRRRHSREWSVVYDSKSKLPIDPAYVTVYDMAGRTITTAITDLDGRFAVLLNRGMYRVEVQKTNYVFPSTALHGMQHDGKYGHLYFGDKIEVLGTAQSLAVSIPMDPVAEDWNQKEKKRRGFFLRPERIRQYRRAMLLYIALGTIIVLTRIFAEPSMIGAPITYLYGGIVALGILRYVLSPEDHYHSLILERRSGRPLSFARVTVFTAKNDFQIMQKMVSFEGQFVALVPNARYYVTIERRLDNGTFEKIYTSSSFSVRKGYIGRVFKV